MQVNVSEVYRMIDIFIISIWFESNIPCASTVYTILDESHSCINIEVDTDTFYEGHHGVGHTKILIVICTLLVITCTVMQHLNMNCVYQLI